MGDAWTGNGEQGTGNGEQVGATGHGGGGGRGDEGAADRRLRSGLGLALIPGPSPDEAGEGGCVVGGGANAGKLGRWGSGPSLTLRPRTCPHPRPFSRRGGRRGLRRGWWGERGEAGTVWERAVAYAPASDSPVGSLPGLFDWEGVGIDTTGQTGDFI